MNAGHCGVSVSMDNRAWRTGFETCNMLFLIYDVLAQPRFHLPYAMSFAPLVPHRNYSEAHLLYCCIILEPVYATPGKFTPESQIKACLGH